MKNRELIGFLKEELFLPDLTSRTKKEVLNDLMEPLVEAGHVKNKNLILDTLLNRETLGSTGIGKGVAIPHCRTLTVTKIVVVVGISKRGLLYDSVDKKKVQLFFLIIAPPHDESNLYLPILGKIVEMVRDTKIRNAMLKAEDYESFFTVIEKG